MPAFTLATLAPLPLLVLGCLLGGAWGWAALLVMTVLTASLDALAADAAPSSSDPDAEFPAADALSVTLALAHLALLALAVAALAGDWLGPAAKVAVFVSCGLFFGQVSNANAHELIHRAPRALRRLGVLVYVSLLFGHHASAHPLVHHVRVATRGDPSSARRGEGFYRFAIRAWRGSFREGLRAESARLAKAGRARWRHPYFGYLAGSLAVLGLSAGLAGPAGLLAHLGLAAFATLQLLLSDYVQHYGLTRAIRPDGRPEPVGARHSWNSPHPASSAFMLNAPRHSDHHAHPSRRYPSLDLPDSAPMLPRSLPVMACLALWPAGWRRVMDPRAAGWSLSQP